MSENPIPDEALIVFAWRYRTELAAKKQFADYSAWVDREAIEGTSAYRLRLEPAEQFDNDWAIAVVDREGGRALREFRWQGEPFQLTAEQVDALLGRVFEIGPGHTRIHHGKVAAPLLRPDGTWEARPPGRG